MHKKILYVLLPFCANFFFAQQNVEFKTTKDYFDYQRFMLNNEFKKKFDNEDDVTAKRAIKVDFSEFMLKLDSIQNTAFIATLIKVKNREDLQHIAVKDLPEIALKNTSTTQNDDDAKYPGGFNALRSQVSQLFYLNSAFQDAKLLKADVVFTVEKDGSIANVHAEGDNFIFNRQAEIAMYLLPEKFSPAMVNGTAARYRFRLPLSMNFE